ncbi:hypothetical protein J6590_069940 [Homalodisca vitripennis]|nr:hypothetical protein J6590_069940 [Homalodisca vitripennis]
MGHLVVPRTLSYHELCAQSSERHTQIAINELTDNTGLGCDNLASSCIRRKIFAHQVLTELLTNHNLNLRQFGAKGDRSLEELEKYIDSLDTTVNKGVGDKALALAYPGHNVRI